MQKLFISYRRNDSQAITGRIYERLAQAYGRRNVFMDIGSILVGMDFRKQIDEALSKRPVVLAIIGPEWRGALDGRPARIVDAQDKVRNEIEHALRQGVPIVPVLVGGANLPTASELPESLDELQFRQAAKVDAGADFDANINRLIHQLDDFLPWWKKAWVKAARSRVLLDLAGLAIVLAIMGTLLYREHRRHSDLQFSYREFSSCGARVLYSGTDFREEAILSEGDRIRQLTDDDRDVIIRLYSAAIQPSETLNQVLETLSRSSWEYEKKGVIASQYRMWPATTYGKEEYDEYAVITGKRQTAKKADAAEEYYIRIHWTKNKPFYVAYQMTHSPQSKSSHRYWNVNEIVSRTLLPESLSDSSKGCDFRQAVLGSQP